MIAALFLVVIGGFGMAQSSPAAGENIVAWGAINSAARLCTNVKGEMCEAPPFNPWGFVREGDNETFILTRPNRPNFRYFHEWPISSDYQIVSADDERAKAGVFHTFVPRPLEEPLDANIIQYPAAFSWDGRPADNPDLARGKFLQSIDDTRENSHIDSRGVPCVLDYEPDAGLITMITVGHYDPVHGYRSCGAHVQNFWIAYHQPCSLAFFGDFVGCERRFGLNYRLAESLNGVNNSGHYARQAHKPQPELGLSPASRIRGSLSSAPLLTQIGMCLIYGGVAYGLVAFGASFEKTKIWPIALGSALLLALVVVAASP